MKPEEQRIAIAEACGWRWVTLRQQEGLCDDVRGYPPDVDYVGLNERYVPDYLDSLDAIHEAEKVKEMHWDQKWVETVVEIALKEAAMKFDRTDGWDWVLLVSRLSATQRAEAFLKTLSLWKNDN